MEGKKLSSSIMIEGLTERPERKLRKHLIQTELLELIPESVCRKYTVIPLEASGNVLHVAMAYTSDIVALEALAAHSQMHIVTEKATAGEIIEAIDFNYQSYEEIEEQILSLAVDEEETGSKVILDTVTDAPVARALAASTVLFII